MKNINVNQLQNQISKIMREVESGEVFEVSRYSKPVAYLVPQKEYESAVSGEGCKKCLTELREIASKLKNRGTEELKDK